MNIWQASEVASIMPNSILKLEKIASSAFHFTQKYENKIFVMHTNNTAYPGYTSLCKLKNKSWKEEQNKNEGRETHGGYPWRRIEESEKLFKAFICHLF